MLTGMGLGGDLVILAIDSRGGQPRFCPDLAYSLAAAELLESAFSGRVRLEGEDDSAGSAPADGVPSPDAASPHVIDRSAVRDIVTHRLRDYGPWRIDKHVGELAAAGVVAVRTVSGPGRSVRAITARDTGRFAAVERRLLGLCDSGSEPAIEDLAFAALAEVGKCADAHLRGRANRERRARLRALADSVPERPGTAGRLLAVCVDVIPGLARKAPKRPGDGRTIDQQIGLTEAGRNAAIFW